MQETELKSVAAKDKNEKEMLFRKFKFQTYKQVISLVREKNISKEKVMLMMLKDFCKINSINIA
jgi:hypothetical protein